MQLNKKKSKNSIKNLDRINLYGMLTLIILGLGCQKGRKSDVIKLDCKVVTELNETDQKLRKRELRSPFFNTLDSLILASGYEKGLDQINMEEMGEQKFLEYWEEAKLYEKPLTINEQRIKDSLWQVQLKIDSLNILKLINLIELYGIDSLNKVDRRCDQNSLSIFVHTPEELKEKVRIIVESNKESIDEERYNHINWHLDGREERVN